MIALSLERHDGALADNVTVRALKLAQYAEAGAALERGDEFRLVELACDRQAGWALTLTPAAYEQAAAAVYQVNTAFFAWYGRRQSLKQLAALALQLNGSLSTPTSPASPRSSA
jgi:hypothetical protein